MTTPTSFKAAEEGDFLSSVEGEGKRRLGCFGWVAVLEDGRVAGRQTER